MANIQTKPADAERLITRARVALLIDQPWFGTLAMKLVIEDGMDKGVDTMATDGTRLYYHPGFTAGLTPQELQGVMAHEVMHCAMLHMFRRENRDMALWNVACDYAINDILITSGFALPKGVLHDKKYSGMTSEKIYALLQQSAANGDPQPQDANGSKGIGGVMDAPKPGKQPGKQGQPGTPGSQPGGNGNQPGNQPPSTSGSQPGNGTDDVPVRTESDWQIDVVQSEKIAASAGKMPGHLAGELRKTRECKTNYREVLKRFIDRTVPMDYSWSKPNRRMLGMGQVLPGIFKEGCGELVIGVDTSGSVPGYMLDQFGADIADILQTIRPSKIHVVYCDAAVGVVQEFQPDGDTFEFSREVSRGGTRFQPVFDWITENNVEPKAILYLTDLEPCDQPTDPGIPVLWCVPETCHTQTFPWGEVVSVTMDQKS
jgi:predicted metal-dependent peptidase